MNPQQMIFRPQPLYQAVFSLPVLIVGVLAYETARAPSPETWLMLGIALVLVVLTLPRAWARVVLTTDRLTLVVPFQRPRGIYLRQLIDFETTGRRWNTLLLRYHPMDEAGRLDIANHAFLGLVPLDQQYLLEERLREILD